jgi:hypothetical protein
MSVPGLKFIPSEEHMHYSTKGPLQERRASEKQAWQERIKRLAGKISTPAPRRYIRHPVTGQLCEVR